MLKRLFLSMILLSIFSATAFAATTDCETFTNSTTSVSFGDPSWLWGGNQQTNGHTNMARSVAMLYLGNYVCNPDVIDTAAFTPLASYVFCSTSSNVGTPNIYVDNFHYSSDEAGNNPINYPTDPLTSTSFARGDVYWTNDTDPTDGVSVKTLLGTAYYSYGGQIHFFTRTNGDVWKNNISPFAGISAKTCRQ